MSTNQQLQDVFAPELWAMEGITQLYKKSQIINLINKDLNGEISKKGDIVNTRLVGKMTAGLHQDGAFNPVNPDVDNVPVVLDQWLESKPVQLDDRVRSMAFQDIATQIIRPAIESLVEYIEAAIFAQYLDFYNFIGSAGTPLSGVAPLSTNIVQKFNDELIPQSDRRMFFNTTAANAWKQVFFNLYAGQNTQTFQEGVLHPTAFGLGNYESVYAGFTHTTAAGWAGGSGAQVNGNQNPSTLGLDSQTLSIKGLGTGSLKKGDILTIAHGSGTKSYVLRADATITANVATAQISPILAAAVTDSTPITVIASHKINLAVHKDAITMVNRPLEVPAANTGLMSVQNYNGLSLRFSRWYSNEQRKEYFQFDTLFGLKTLDRRKGFRVIE